MLRCIGARTVTSTDGRAMTDGEDELAGGRPFHLTLWLVWWLLVGVPVLVGGVAVMAGFGNLAAARVGLGMSLSGMLVAVFVHTTHLARRPGCPRCIQALDWVVLSREAYNAGMAPDAFMDLNRPGGPSVSDPRGPRRMRAPARARVRTRSTVAR